MNPKSEMTSAGPRRARQRSRRTTRSLCTLASTKLGHGRRRGRLGRGAQWSRETALEGDSWKVMSNSARLVVAACHVVSS
eukprot:4147670-Pyramimonas_sp.AAC.1